MITRRQTFFSLPGVGSHWCLALLGGKAHLVTKPNQSPQWRNQDFISGGGGESELWERVPRYYGPPFLLKSDRNSCQRGPLATSYLSPPPPGGVGSDPPPLGFSGITSSFITVSTWNLAHLSGHQFGVVSCKENQNRPEIFCYRSNFVTSLHAILGR